jgi:hypothetical protein
MAAYAVEADGAVRGNLASALANTASPTAIPRLLKTMKDADPSVRSQSIHGLGRMASELKKPELFAGARSAIGQQQAGETAARVKETMDFALKAMAAGK